MKICVVCLTNKGGMIHYASQLSNSLSKENNVFFITSQGFRDVDYFNKSIQIQTVPLHPKNIFSLFWIRFDILISIIDKINPDIIHVTKEHPLLVPLLFRIKKPIVLTLHDVTKHPGDKDFLGTFKIASWLFIKRSQKIFVHGTTLKNELIKGGVTSEKIVIIPHADYSFFRKYTTTPISTDFGESQNTALFFGRISKYKGLKYLIDAVPIISKYIANFNLIIAGEGDASDITDLIRNKNITLKNRYISDEEVAELFVNSKVIVMPYIEASQSGIIPIAYAFKRPVVATNVGSIPEAIVHGVTGFLVPPKDPVSLAKAVIAILQDDCLRKQMGENAYIKMEKDLSWDKVAATVVETYKQILESKY